MSASAGLDHYITVIQKSVEKILLFYLYLQRNKRQLFYVCKGI